MLRLPGGGGGGQDPPQSLRQHDNTRHGHQDRLRARGRRQAHGSGTAALRPCRRLPTPVHPGLSWTGQRAGVREPGGSGEVRRVAGRPAPPRHSPLLHRASVPRAVREGLPQTLRRRRPGLHQGDQAFRRRLGDKQRQDGLRAGDRGERQAGGDRRRRAGRRLRRILPEAEGVQAGDSREGEAPRRHDALRHPRLPSAAEGTADRDGLAALPRHRGSHRDRPGQGRVPRRASKGVRRRDPGHGLLEVLPDASRGRGS